MTRLQEEQERLHRQKRELEASLAAATANHEEALAALPRLAKAFEGWSQTLQDLEAHLAALPGDALLASGFLAYAGFFESKRRNALKAKWAQRVRVPSPLSCCCAVRFSRLVVLLFPPHSERASEAHQT